MNILIYGSGAVGRYLGAHLARTISQVTFISRSQSAQLNESGLVVHKDEGATTLRAKPTFVSSLRQALIRADEQNKPYDYILIATKSYDLPDVINQLVAYIPEPPPIITMQNGIDVELMLSNQFGPEGIIAGSLTIPVSYNHNLNIVEERADRGISLASVAGSNNHKRVANIFKNSGLNVHLVQNHEEMKWSKALTNMVGNATSAIVNRHPGILYKYKPIFQLEVRMLQEALAVMKAKELKVINLPGTPVKRMVRAIRWLPQGWLQSVMTRQVTKGRGDKMPSFQIDLAAGKEKNEVLFHNGAVNRIGHDLGVTTYVNAALTNILIDIAYGARDWHEFSGKPKNLLAAINEHMRAQRDALIQEGDD